MFLLGILSLFQIIFLPGYIILRMFRYENSFSKQLILSFALSQIFNYLLVFILTSLGLYKFVFVLCLITLEIIVLIWLQLNDKKKSIDKAELFWVILAANGFIILGAWILNQYVFRSGSVFWGADELIMWNKLALLWADNKLPGTNANAYAQLLITNWSLTYVLIKDLSVNFFAKAIMPIYAFYILLAGYCLAVSEKKLTYWAGWLTLIITVFTAWRNYPSITMGLFDIPVSCMVFISFMLLYTNRNTVERNLLLKNLILSVIIAAGSAVTKPSGLVYLAVYPLLTFLLYRKNKTINTKEKRLFLISYFIIGAFLVFPWYLYNEILRIKAGGLHSLLDHPLFSYINDSVIQRFLKAIPILEGNFFGKTGLLIYFFFSLWSTYKSDFKWPMLLICYPIMILWFLFVSYEFRNTSIAIPFIGLSLGLGISGFILWLSDFVPQSIKVFFQNRHKVVVNFAESCVKQIRKLVIYLKSWAILAAVLIAMVFIGLSFHFTSSYLHAEQIKRDWNYIGDFRVMNQVLHETYLQGKIHGVILSDYEFLSHLPGVQSEILSGMQFDQMTNILNRKNYHYVLYYYEKIATNKSAEQWLVSGTNNLKMQVLFLTNDWIFIENLK